MTRTDGVAHQFPYLWLFPSRSRVFFSKTKTNTLRSNLTVSLAENNIMRPRAVSNFDRRYSSLFFQYERRQSVAATPLCRFAKPVVPASVGFVAAPNQTRRVRLSSLASQYALKSTCLGKCIGKMPISRYSVCCVLMTLFHCLYMSVAEYATQLNPSISSKPTIPVSSHETGDPIFKDVQQHQIPLENAGPPRCAFRVSNSPARHQLVSVHTVSALTCAAGDQKVNFRQKRKNVNLRRHAFTTSSANDIQSKQRDSDRADSVAAARRGPKTGREVEGLLRWGRPSHIRLVGHETNRDTSFYSRHLDLPQVDNPSSLFERAAMTKSYTGRTGHAGRVTNTEYHHLPGSFGHIKKRVPRTQPGQSLASSFFNVSAGFNFTVLLGMVCTFSLLLAIIWVFYQVRVVVRELSKLADFLVSTNELPFVVV